MDIKDFLLLVQDEREARAVLCQLKEDYAKAKREMHDLDRALSNAQHAVFVAHQAVLAAQKELILGSGT